MIWGVEKIIHTYKSTDQKRTKGPKAKKNNPVGRYVFNGKSFRLLPATCCCCCCCSCFWGARQEVVDILHLPSTSAGLYQFSLQVFKKHFLCFFRLLDWVVEEFMVFGKIQKTLLTRARPLFNMSWDENWLHHRPVRARNGRQNEWKLYFKK